MTDEALWTLVRSAVLGPIVPLPGPQPIDPLIRRVVDAVRPHIPRESHDGR